MRRDIKFIDRKLCLNHEQSLVDELRENCHTLMPVMRGGICPSTTLSNLAQYIQLSFQDFILSH